MVDSPPAEELGHSLARRLRHLEEARKDGLITDKEYAAQREKILQSA